MKEPEFSVLFVCLGNICRSPTARGVFEELLRREGWHEHVRLESAGTSDYHVGHPPDPRALAAASGRGIDLSAHRARQVQPADFVEFDYILAMDRQNLRDLKVMRPADYHGHLGLFLEFAGTDTVDVPDPYYGGAQGFEVVLDVLEEGSRALLEHCRRRHG